MSNPFTARRERQTEKAKAKMEELGIPQQAAAIDDEGFTPVLPQRGGNYSDENFDKYLPPSATVDQAPMGGGAGYGRPEAPSRARLCMYKLQSSFAVGFTLGGAVGFLYGGYMAVQHKHVLYVPIAIVQFGGMFGGFLAAGSVIRCEETGEVLALREGRLAREEAAARRAASSGGSTQPRLLDDGRGEQRRRSLVAEASLAPPAPSSTSERRRGPILDAILMQ